MRRIAPINKHSQRKSIALLSVFLFIYIFQPPVLKTNIRLILTIIALCYIAVNTFRHPTIRVQKDVLKPLFFIAIFTVCFVLFQIGRITLNNPPETAYIRSLTTSVLLIVIYTTIACIFLVQYSNHNGLSYSQICSAVINAGVVELCCVILSFISPGIRQTFNSLMISNVRDEQMSINFYKFTWQRTYGFADNLFDGFGYLTSIIIVITFLKGFREKKKRYVILSFVMLIMPLLNSRTGLLLSAVGYIIVLIAYFSPRKLFKYMCLAGLGIGGVLLFVNRLPAETADWVMRGVTQTLDLFGGDVDSGVYHQILVADLQFPNSIIWGAGYRPNAIGRVDIDSGYVQCIWRFGLLLSILFFGALLYYFITVFSELNNKDEKILIILLVMFLLLFFIKESPFGLLGAHILTFGLPIVMLNGQKSKETIWRSIDI